MKSVLMIHEIQEELFTLPLENCVLTFDDGLYSQYHCFERIKNIPTQKIFFISTNIISNGYQSAEFPDCRTAHSKAMNGNYEDYMTVEQIKELMEQPDVYIGGHSHDHFDVSHMSLSHKIEYLKNDTEKMLEWFQHNLGTRPTKFCFPYNNDYAGIYQAVLQQYGFTEFYGKERIAAECLFTSQL